MPENVHHTNQNHLPDPLPQFFLGLRWRLWLLWPAWSHVYAAALERELQRLGLRAAREYWVRMYCDGSELCQQWLDFVVNERLVAEIKSTVDFHRRASRQLLNYLPATTLEVGLLFHFGPAARFYWLCTPNDRKRHPSQSNQST